jgi:hypothetical protein
MTLIKGVVVSRVLARSVLALGLVFSATQVFGGDLTKAETLYQRTDYEGSLALLDKHMQSNDSRTTRRRARHIHNYGLQTREGREDSFVPHWDLRSVLSEDCR